MCLLDVVVEVCLTGQLDTTLRTRILGLVMNVLNMGLHVGFLCEHLVTDRTLELLDMFQIDGRTWSLDGRFVDTL